MSDTWLYLYVVSLWRSPPRIHTASISTCNGEGRIVTDTEGMWVVLNETSLFVCLVCLCVYVCGHSFLCIYVCVWILNLTHLEGLIWRALHVLIYSQCTYQCTYAQYSPRRCMCYVYYFVRNSPVALLEAQCARLSLKETSESINPNQSGHISIIHCQFEFRRSFSSNFIRKHYQIQFLLNYSNKPCARV